MSLTYCREPNIIITYKTKVHKGEKDEFCRNIYTEVETKYRLILYSKNATPSWRTDITVDYTVIAYAGHAIDELPRELFGREVQYEMLCSGECGTGVVVVLPSTTNPRVRKVFGQPVQLLLKLKGG